MFISDSVKTKKIGSSVLKKSFNQCSMSKQKCVGLQITSMKSDCILKKNGLSFIKCTASVFCLKLSLWFIFSLKIHLISSS